MIQGIMDSLIDFVWHNSSSLSLVGLAASLIGLVLIPFGLVDYLKKHEEDLDQPIAGSIWRDPWGKIGCILLACGITLALFVITLRIMIPASD
jgi:hypothetical protein